MSPTSIDARIERKILSIRAIIFPKDTQMSRNLNDRSGSPGMSPMLAAEVLRALGQAKVILDSIDGGVDEAMLERAKKLIDDVVPKLAR